MVPGAPGKKPDPNMGGKMEEDLHQLDLFQQDTDIAKADCRALCKETRIQSRFGGQGSDIWNQGPCLSDLPESKWAHPDWVCDIAHHPRNEGCPEGAEGCDDALYNQCSGYKANGGAAKHYVEVDTLCAPFTAV